MSRYDLTVTYLHTLNIAYICVRMNKCFFLLYQITYNSYYNQILSVSVSSVYLYYARREIQNGSRNRGDNH